MRPSLTGAIGIAVIAALLFACSGGSNLSAGIDGSGARSPVVTQGPIQGFGSVIVNGRHYSLTTAQIDVDGAPSTQADLAVGQVVTVMGTVDSNGADGVADSVQLDLDVVGPVQSIDAAAGTLVVLGQQVAIDSDTVFGAGIAGTGLAGVAVGDFVRVSGLAAPSGAIRATWIARDAAPGMMRVVGRVAALDSAGLRFVLGGLTVDYSAAALVEGFASGGPSDGDRVRVEGRSLAADGALVADSVAKLAERFQEREGEGLEIEGLITRFASPKDFEVAGHGVTTNPGTVYEGGSEAGLALDVKVQVEGTADSTGIIVATKIEIKDGGSVREGDD